VRVDCPFCHGKRNETAWVAYETGWFECYRCGENFRVGTDKQRVYISAIGGYVTREIPAATDIVTRFRAQIRQAASNVKAKYGEWVPRWEAEAFAEERVMMYAAEHPTPGNSRAGKLADWEDAVKGDPNQLDRYVLRALTCDLFNYARAKVRRVRREKAIEISLATGLKLKDARKLADDENSGNQEIVTKLISRNPPDMAA